LRTLKNCEKEKRKEEEEFVSHGDLVGTSVGTLEGLEGGGAEFGTGRGGLAGRLQNGRLEAWKFG